MRVRTDCAHFDGYKPCLPHKREGVHCDGCPHYERVGDRILILKLGAAGEVVRCTSILRFLERHHPGAEIVWLTEYPELIPDGRVQEALRPDPEALEWLKAQYWNLVLSLDKDRLPCALATQLRCDRLKGFRLNDAGRIVPADEHARHKWTTGIFDDVMKRNTRHYLDELFEVCGWSYSEERYVLPEVEPQALDVPAGATVVGLNTGAGRAWATRIWPEQNFLRLILRLQSLNLEPVLLGGPDEHDRNRRLAGATGARYPGVQPLRRFLGVVHRCGVVVTAASLALHVAIGLHKRIVLLNNVFNRHEFHLFGLGEVLEPDLPCLGCYKPCFDSQCPVPNCMHEITVPAVVQAVERQLALGKGQGSRVEGVGLRVEG